MKDSVQKNLKKNKYADKKQGSRYIIKNKKTGKIVEVVAKSSMQAANLVGWRPRHTIVVLKSTENENE